MDETGAVEVSDEEEGREVAVGPLLESDDVE